MKVLDNSNLVVDSFSDEYWKRFNELSSAPPEPYEVQRSVMYRDDGPHEVDFTDYECAFAAGMLKRYKPQVVLDVGSYRRFVLGLSSEYDIISVDIRDRPVVGDTKIVVCDAKLMPFGNGVFDAVLSLCSLEHFGLGRYGDAFDLKADGKAMLEMKRVLKPGGLLILSTTVTFGKPSIWYNAHRVYSYDMILNFCDELMVMDETSFSFSLSRFCKKEEVSVDGKMDIYCGCWKK